MRRNNLIWLLLIVGWYLLALFISNPFIVPSPIHVFQDMVTLCLQPIFYTSIGYTTFRVLIAFILSFGCAIICVYLSYCSIWIRDLLSKLILCVRSIPNVTIIILVLFWVSRETMAFLVCYLLLFPMFYQSLLDGVDSVHDMYKDVLLIYPQSLWTRFTRIYLPELKSVILTNVVNGSSLGFKVMIMAEILGQVPIGIGRQIQLARLDIDISLVIAYTLWLLILVFVFDRLFRILVSYAWGK